MFGTTEEGISIGHEHSLSQTVGPRNRVFFLRICHYWGKHVKRGSKT